MKNYPCDKEDCITHKRWENEMPYVAREDNVNVILICLSCIHFRAEDNYLPEEQEK